MVEVLLPIRTRSEANLREHWARRARRAREQRLVARTLVGAKVSNLSGFSCVITVTLTRIAPRRLDSDNLARSFKAVRDGVADALGIDDGSSRIKWCYAQRKGRPHEYAVLVRIQNEHEHDFN